MPCVPFLASTKTPKAPVGPSIYRETASLWARVLACSFLKRWNTRLLVVQLPLLKLSALVQAPTRIELLTFIQKGADLQPQFVDALVRSGIGLSGVNLEIGVGYRPRGSASRGLLDFSQLIDQWSNLGIPLHVTLAFPSASGADPQSKSDLEVDVGHWKHDWSESAQADWIDLYLPLLMAKESVVGIYWAHFTDQKPHDFPHAGLLRADGAAKPILERFLKYRRTYWQPDDDEDAS